MIFIFGTKFHLYETVGEISIDFQYLIFIVLGQAMKCMLHTFALLFRPSIESKVSN